MHTIGTETKILGQQGEQITLFMNSYDSFFNCLTTGGNKIHVTILQGIIERISKKRKSREDEMFSFSNNIFF